MKVALVLIELYYNHVHSFVDSIEPYQESMYHENREEKEIAERTGIPSTLLNNDYWMRSIVVHLSIWFSLCISSD